MALRLAIFAGVSAASVRRLAADPAAGAGESQRHLRVTPSLAEVSAHGSLRGRSAAESAHGGPLVSRQVLPGKSNPGKPPQDLLEELRCRDLAEDLRNVLAILAVPEPAGGSGADRVGEYIKSYKIKADIDDLCQAFIDRKDALSDSSSEFAVAQTESLVLFKWVPWVEGKEAGRLTVHVGHDENMARITEINTKIPESYVASNELSEDVPPELIRKIAGFRVKK